MLRNMNWKKNHKTWTLVLSCSLYFNIHIGKYVLGTNCSRNSKTRVKETRILTYTERRCVKEIPNCLMSREVNIYNERLQYIFFSLFYFFITIMTFLNAVFRSSCFVRFCFWVICVGQYLSDCSRLRKRMSVAIVHQTVPDCNDTFTSALQLKTSVIHLNNASSLSLLWWTRI